MIALVPEWAHNYEEFWIAVRRRNLWFIRLRYFFVVLLYSFMLGGEFLLNFKLTEAQIIAISVIGVIILSYNLIIQLVRPRIGCTPGRLNCLHLSLIQMLLDLLALMVLVYYTGTIHSPLYMFFIFQMVIGSLILPGSVVYTVAALVAVIFSSLVFLQHYNIIDTHLIAGLYLTVPEHIITFDVLFLAVFNAMLIFIVYLANKIAKSLYRREKQLRESLDQLNEAEIAKQKYIVGVVHEIKTPIAAVQSLLDLIVQNYLGPVSDEIKEKLLRAKIRSTEGISLINNVLRISKLKLLEESVTERIDLREMLRSLIERQSDQAKQNKIDIRFDDKRIENIPIEGDKVLLELAFSNIIGNSVKYNADGGLIEVIVEDEVNRIKIEICDNGIGIPQKDSFKVFQQFYRASNIKNKQFEGSGLGLSLVQEIIQRYNGSIDVSSPSRLASEGKPGTCVTVKLPYIEVERKIVKESIFTKWSDL